MTNDDRDLVHARALLLEISKGDDGVDPLGKNIGFNVMDCDPVCGWDREDGIGKCGRPIRKVCSVQTPEVLHTVVFCRKHGEVMRRAMDEFRAANPKD